MLYLVDLQAKVFVHTSDDERELREMIPRYKTQAGLHITGVVARAPSTVVICEGPSLAEQREQDEADERAEANKLAEVERTKHLDEAQAAAIAASVEAKRAADHVDKLRKETPLFRNPNLRGFDTDTK